MKLIVNALAKYIMGLVLIGSMLFLPAWTLLYSGAWLFLGLLFVPMLLLGIFLFIKSPDLLKRRDRKSTRLNSSHAELSRMPSSA